MTDQFTFEVDRYVTVRKRQRFRMLAEAADLETARAGAVHSIANHFTAFDEDVLDKGVLVEEEEIDAPTDEPTTLVLVDRENAKIIRPAFGQPRGERL